MRPKLDIFIAVQTFLTLVAKASIYPISSKAWIPSYQHAEKVFGSNKGPLFARTGNSTLKVTLKGDKITNDLHRWSLTTVIYHLNSYDSFVRVQLYMERFACSGEKSFPYGGISKIERYVSPLSDEIVQGTAEYQVKESGWIVTQIFICPTNNTKVSNSADSNTTNNSDNTLSIDTNDAYITPVYAYTGTLEIRNPYGLLPAPIYGMLPFSGFLALGYLGLYAFFALLMVKHRSQLIRLHYGIFVILLLGALANVIWFLALYSMNSTGDPVCCPYPTKLLTAVIFNTLMRTLARAILVVVCLGYGIVRERLSLCEVASVSILSLVYFLCGIGDEVSRGTSSGIEFRHPPTAWSFAQLICNLAFIIWIHLSMERIMTDLNEQKQFAKFKMYRSLAWALASFIIFFSILTVIAVSSRVGIFEWSIEWEWTQLVAWPVLDFVVSASMCSIWRPTKNSSNLAYSMQLPQMEGVEMINQSPLVIDNDTSKSSKSPVGTSSEKQSVRSSVSTTKSDDGDSETEAQFN
uniref:Gpr7 transmembrane protein putative n=1 Tax=Albugo laibachii Nc14 TaxID=890382 RepID=F0WJH7_9STRA|nr:Gpr7 transmembrane protein putative [Albugo laibachii Nc14]|eukprot:CCA21426.1 Gpr7 transmembrane protein putative [Albugo laibachii Nc14]